MGRGIAYRRVVKHLAKAKVRLKKHNKLFDLKKEKADAKSRRTNNA